MIIAIMQPYFFPYIGYFQLMNAVNEFIVYDHIEYSKKGWINRNRILVNGKDSYISVPLKHDSDYRDIADRYLADIWSSEKVKLLNKIAGSYRKAPQFNVVYPLLEKSISYGDNNLFNFILNTLHVVTNYLEIRTPIIVSSSLLIDRGLPATRKIIEICKLRGANVYINAIGGIDLYNSEDFRMEGIELRFLKTGNIAYKQMDNEFVSHLSIIDVMMFNSKQTIKEYLTDYSLI